MMLDKINCEKGCEIWTEQIGLKNEDQYSLFNVNYVMNVLTFQRLSNTKYFS